MKTKLVLLMYDALLSGGSILREDFCKKHKICERTFYRYLVFLNEFLETNRPQFNVVNDGLGVYFLKKN